jgi:hypothetical protein
LSRTGILETLDGELNALAHGHSSARPRPEVATGLERKANRKYRDGLSLWTNVDSRLVCAADQACFQVRHAQNMPNWY